jgi:hypothetical protein
VRLGPSVIIRHAPKEWKERGTNKITWRPFKVKREGSPPSSVGKGRKGKTRESVIRCSLLSKVSEHVHRTYSANMEYEALNFGRQNHLGNGAHISDKQP